MLSGVRSTLPLCTSLAPSIGPTSNLWMTAGGTVFNRRKSAIYPPTWSTLAPPFIDDMVDSRGRPEGWMSVKGLKATAQRDGYGRYCRFRTDLGAVIHTDWFLCVNYRRWATSGHTPLWLWVGSDVPINPADLRGNVPSLVEHGGSSGPYDVPIYLTARGGIRARPRQRGAPDKGHLGNGNGYLR